MAALALVLLVLGAACGITTLVCWVIILIEAFQNEVWKGLAFFICGFYALYYALFEYDSDKKMLVTAGFFSGLFFTILIQILSRTVFAVARP